VRGQGAVATQEAGVTLTNASWGSRSNMVEVKHAGPLAFVPLLEFGGGDATSSSFGQCTIDLASFTCTWETMF
jgi:hypothetical protein